MLHFPVHPAYHCLLALALIVGSAPAQTDRLGHDHAESVNSLLLNTMAAAALQEKREEDAAFLFLAGQARFQIDAKVYPPLRKGGDSPATLIGTLAAVMSRPALDAVIRDPERMQRLVARLEKWSPQFDDYDPGYEYESKLLPAERAAIVKDVVAKLLAPLRAEATLLQNPEYAAVSKEIEKWQAAINNYEVEANKGASGRGGAPISLDIAEAARVAKINQDAALARRQSIEWKLLPETRFHKKHGWVAENYFDDPQVIALCRAIEVDDLAEMRKLIEAGANVKAIGKEGMTPLLWAYPDNKFERFELLLQQGADPNVFFESDFGIGHLNPKGIFHPLPDGHGVIDDWGCHMGQSVTHKAAASPYAKYLVAVMAHGGDAKLVDKKTGDTPLNVVVQDHRDRYEQVKLLVAAGADPQRFSEWHKKYPIEMAIYRQDDATASFLWKDCGVKIKALPPERQKWIVRSVMNRYSDGYNEEDKIFQEL